MARDWQELEPRPEDGMEPSGLNGLDEQEELQDRLSAFIGKLASEAKRRVDKRLHVEERWIEDLRQYHGIYTPDMQQRLKEMEASAVFINLTATKTDAMEARLIDLLFPTDDRNWGIQPTPVPELTEGAEAALSRAEEARAVADQQMAAMTEAVEAGNEPAALDAEAKMRAAEAEENDAQAAADRLHEVLNEAKRRSTLMQEEIEDQLQTCNMPAEARDAIADACKIGCGVLKGPVLGERHSQRWREQIDERGTKAFSLVTEADGTPSVYRVDPWSFFPDPDARRPEDCEGFFERHLMNKGQLRKLARRADIDSDAVRALLKAGPDGGETPAFMAELHSMTGQGDGEIRDRYHVWEYTGPIEAEDMKLLADAFEDEEMLADLEDADPLDELHAKVWFCQGKVLSFAIHPLDSGEPLYSVFTIRRDEAGLFGFGIPYIMRHPQSVMNGAYRMMMDNSGLGTGPQIVVNTDAITPEDGSWKIKPRKVWKRNNTDSQPGVPAFETYNIETHQQELANIIGLAGQTIDEVTAMPAIAQGEQGTGVTKTAQGMALLMNSANVSFRRIVKSYDDDVTVPLLRRFFHWNMQFSAKDEIKGDFEVVARGSSVLLVREMQAQNLLMIAQMFGDHPIYGPMLKHGDLLRQIFKAHMIPADEIVKSDREFKEWQAEQSEQQDPAAMAAQAQAEAQMAEIELRREEMEQKGELSNMEWDYRFRIEQMRYDAAMNKAAEALNMKREELDAKIAQAEQQNASAERRLAVEAGMRERTGISSGGAI
jgi:hypothetical protein